MNRTSFFLPLCVLLWLAASAAPAPAVEPGGYRLLSVSESEKLILVSRLSDKAKFLLDAAGAKITVNGKLAEFKDLAQYSIVGVRMKPGKAKRKSVTLDGEALDIAVENLEAGAGEAGAGAD